MSDFYFSSTINGQKEAINFNLNSYLSIPYI